MPSRSSKENGLVFDDEPMDSILYGKDTTQPTPVDVFLPIKKHMRSVRDAYSSGDTEALINGLVEITDRDMVLHRPICVEIVNMTAQVIPNAPLPTLPYEIIGLTPLLERIWDLQKISRDHARSELVGTRLYRCYEHQGRYQAARRVLKALIRIAQTNSNSRDQAVYTNNLAFEFLLEQRWQDAMPMFQQAEQLFFDLGDRFNCANSRSNYLTCVFALRPAHELEEFRSELEDLVNELSRSESWHARKPYVLLSKILEAKNDVPSAIACMRKAIAATETNDLRWTDLDRTRLETLKAKL